MAPAQPSVSASSPVHSLEPIRLFGNIVQVYAWACPISNARACQVAAYYPHGEGKIPGQTPGVDIATKRSRRWPTSAPQLRNVRDSRVARRPAAACSNRASR